MDYSSNSPVGDLLSSKFINKLESIATLAKKLLRNRSRAKVKHWQGNESWEFADYRAYVPGDDLRMVDWNIYRRLREVVVREYETEAPTHLIIVIDTSPSMQPYGKFLLAQQLAATIAYTGLSLLDKVSVFAFPQGETLSFASSRGKNNAMSILKTLNNLTIYPIQDLEKAFHQIRSITNKHCKCIVISDFYDNIYRKNLNSLRVKSNGCTAVHIVANQEYSPQLSGIYQLQDSESKQLHTIHVTPERLQKYQENFRRHIQQLRKFCVSNRISHTLVDNDKDLSVSLNILSISGILK